MNNLARRPMADGTPYGTSGEDQGSIPGSSVPVV